MLCLLAGCEKDFIDLAEIDRDAMVHALKESENFDRHAEEDLSQKSLDVLDQKGQVLWNEHFGKSEKKVSQTQPITK